MYTHIWKIFKT